MKTKRSRPTRHLRGSADQAADRLNKLHGQELLSFFRALEPQMIQWLKQLVNTDTPSDHKQPLDELATWFAGEFRSCNAEVEVVKNRDAGNHLLARWTGSTRSRKQVLILGHLDTVWGLQESQRRPAQIERGKLFGP